MYGQLGEIRSVLPVPCIDMTATASKKTASLVKDVLDLKDCVDVIVPPNKCNVKYSVFDQGEKENISKSFGFIVHDLETRGILTDKLIIFTKSYKDCNLVYEFFSNALGEKSYSPYNISGPNNDKNRLFDMFHSNVESEQKKSSVESFNDPDGNIRILIATSALWMGVDIKDVYECYHFSPPSDFDSYLQESDRVGRSADKVSHAVMIIYKTSTQGKVSLPMKGYTKNQTVCRRKLIYSEYMDVVPENDVLHTCCDICAEKCKCPYCDSCVPRLYVSLKSAAAAISHSAYSSEVVQRKLPAGLKMLFQKELLVYRKDLCNCVDSCTFTGYDIATGFSTGLISQLVDNIEKISDKDVLSEFPFFHSSHANKVWQIIEECFESFEMEKDDHVYTIEEGDDNIDINHADGVGTCSDDEDDDDDYIIRRVTKKTLLLYLSSDSESD